MRTPENLLYGIKPTAREYTWPHFVHYSGQDAIMSPPECDAIIDFCKSDACEMKPGAIGGGGVHSVELEYRSANQGTIPYNEKFAWLYDRIASRVAWANNQQFGFEISGLNEEIQILEYETNDDDDIPNGHYKWHVDVGPTYTSLRKLSLVINLTDPKEYDGCNLKIFDCTTPEWENPFIGRGDMVIFPSFLPHMVTPITRGTRYALVLWVSGPPFR